MSVRKTSLSLFAGTILIVSAALTGCDDEKDSPITTQPEPPIPSHALMMPSRAVANSVVPLMVTLDRDIRLDQNAYLTTESSMRNVSPFPVNVKRGRGGRLLATYGGGETVITVHADDAVEPLVQTLRVLNDLPVRELSGTLTGDDLLWDTTAVIQVNGSVTVPAGAILSILPGTIVLLGTWANILVEGSISAGSCCGDPIQMLPLNQGEPWGKIHHYGGSRGNYQRVFFIGGGGNSANSFGHSGSQPVLSGSECEVDARSIAVMDCPGKAFGFSESEVDIRSSLITRCDTGGEFERSLVFLVDSHIIDIPDGDGLIDDDDNDGIYYDTDWIGGETPSILSGCVVMTTEDDCVDHNGANLLIEECVLDGAYHEGVAASDYNEVRISNTLVLNCEQGIEAGFGTPQVFVDHCTVLGNRIGLRLGDSYDFWTDLGHMTVTNSIVAESDSLNVWNYDLSIAGPREGAFNITYSIVNSAEYDSGAGCLTGEPVFESDYLITSESVGAGAAQGGTDMGIGPRVVIIPAH